MKKILFGLLIIGLLFMTGCKKEESENTKVGGWTMNPNFVAATVPKDAIEAFNKGADKYEEMVLKPINLLGTQVVSGTNYMFLCKGTKDNTSAYYVVIVYKNLKNKCEVTKVTEFNLEEYANIENNNYSTEELSGGWKVFSEVGESRLTKEEQEIFNASVEKLLGVKYTAIANLGTQVVAGTNYAMLVLGESVSEKPVNFYSIFTIYVDLDGNKKVTSINNIDLTKFNK